MTRERASFAEIAALAGAPPRHSDWLTIDQARIDGFARDTGDDAFIHTDPVRARATRFGGTIAHGLLTLSILPYLMRSAMPVIADSRMGVNYGFDRVRFLSPVPVDSRVRACFAVVAAERREDGFATLTYDVTIEIDGVDRPALIAQWVLGHWLAAP